MEFKVEIELYTITIPNNTCETYAVWLKQFMLFGLNKVRYCSTNEKARYYFTRYRKLSSRRGNFLPCFTRTESAEEAG